MHLDEHEIFHHADQCVSTASAEGFRRDFCSDLAIVEKCIGPNLFAGVVMSGSAAQPSGTATHRELSTLIAGETCLLLEVSQYRSWSDGLDTGRLLAKWQRIAWQYALVYPIGFLIANTKILRTGGNVSWSPAVQDMAKYSSSMSYTVSFSGRAVDGASISFDTFRRLFPATAQEKSPWLRTAISDAFAARPNTDNPLYASLRRAIRKRVLLEEFQMPFWWAYAINYLFRYDEDFVPLTPLFARVDGRHALTPQEVARTSVTQSHSQRPLPSADAEPNTVKPGSDDSPDNAVEQAEVLNDSNVADATTPQAVPELLVAIARVCKRLVADKVMTLNQQGAQVHVFGGVPHAICPIFFEYIATGLDKPGIRGDEVYGCLRENGLLAIDAPQEDAVVQFGFCPADGSTAGRVVGRARGIALAAGACRVLFGVDSLPDNPDVAPS